MIELTTVKIKMHTNVIIIGLIPSTAEIAKSKNIINGSKINEPENHQRPQNPDAQVTTNTEIIAMKKAINGMAGEVASKSISPKKIKNRLIK